MHLQTDWDSILQAEKQKDYLQKIDSFLAKEYKTKTIYPEAKNIFNALQTTSLADTKVVILGQDPYHGPNQAHGFAFSVQPGVALPPSLRNMYKELEQEYNVTIQANGDLTRWAKQGVLLLNTILTVEDGKPLSHANIGWQTFTTRVIEEINKKDQAVVFLLWGAKAKSVMPLLTNPNHLILTSPHPSPLSAHRGFFGNNHFKLANQFLEQHNQTPIQWI